MSTALLRFRKCLSFQHLCLVCFGFLNRRSQVRVLPGVVGEADKTADDNKGKERSKSAKNQEVASTPTDGSTTLKKPPELPTDDSTNTIKVTRSDKLDNKLSNKPDPDLSEIIAAWPELPEHIRAAVKALISI